MAVWYHLPFTASATSPRTTNMNPTAISSNRIDRNAEAVTTELAMLVVILVTLAAGQILATVANWPRTASSTMKKMPTKSISKPTAMMLPSPAAWNENVAGASS